MAPKFDPNEVMEVSRSPATSFVTPNAMHSLAGRGALLTSSDAICRCL